MSGSNGISTLIISKENEKVYFIHNSKIINELALSTLKITLNGKEIRNVNIMNLAPKSPFDSYDFMQLD